MKSWPIGRRVAATCATLVVFSVAISTVGYLSVHRLMASLQHTATDALPGIQQLTLVQSLGLELRGTSLLLGTPGLADNYRDQQFTHLRELAKQMRDQLMNYERTVSATERPLYEATLKETEALIQSCERFQELALHGSAGEAGVFWSANGSARSKAFRKAVQDEVNLNKAEADRSLHEGLSAAHWGNSLSFCLLGLAVLLGAGICALVVRNISSALRKVASGIQTSATQVNGASQQVAASSRKLAETSTEQAAAVEETSASGHEISAITRSNEDHCQSAVSLMTETEELVVKTNRTLDDTVASMQEINTSAERISRIIKVIDEIAFQTNILALNAAVEAARAGEAGLGFAVVAEEVRNLAGRCQSAAKDISGLIEDSVNLAQKGSSRLDECAKSVADMASSAMKVKTLIHQIHDQARQQSEGMSQISRALVQMEQVTQHNAASAEESASASLEMSGQAETLQNIIDSLEQLVG